MAIGFLGSFYWPTEKHSDANYPDITLKVYFCILFLYNVLRFIVSEIWPFFWI